MSAGAAHPPGVFDSEAVLAEYSVQQGVVTQPTVLVMIMPEKAEQAILRALMAHDNFTAIRPQSDFMIMPKSYAVAYYYLRC
jgi:hypothetical protein